MNHIETADGRLRLWETFRGLAPGELFSYWTEPAKLRAWWPQEVAIEPAVGGHYTYGFPQAGHILSGTFSEVIPGKRLAFSWHWQHEPDAPERQVVVDFESRGDDALLTVTQGPYGEMGADVLERQQQLEGWQYFLARLKQHIRLTHERRDSARHK